MNIYEYLVEGNKKYGSNKEHICKSNFRCNSCEIQEKVIIAPTWEVDIFKNHVDYIKQISGPTGHGYSIYELIFGDKKVTYIITGVGACNLMDAVLALGCTSCKEILFIGSVGALDKSMKVGDIVIPEYSVCGVGPDRYLTTYNAEQNDTYGKKYYPNKDFFTKVLESANKIVESSKVKVHIGKTFSVDTIFAQYAHLDEFINMGCNTIEMETSTLFLASNVVGIKSAAAFVVSDNTVINKSLYSGRTDEEQKKRKKVKKDLIPKIAKEIVFDCF
ncbi:MAG: phosphorylase [Clostridia bacterium]|nr:phosphorylase [Clostridia bacterium]